ncbi:MAG: hypothetical protein ACRED4_03335 [Brevundimonas sp.]
MVVLAGAFALIGGSAHSLQRAPNPLVLAYGPDLVVEEIDLEVQHGLFEGNQDRAAAAYLLQAMPAAQRQLFDARYPAGIRERDAAEEMAEFLTLSNLQQRLAEDDVAGRKVRLVVRVDEARSLSMTRMLFSPIPGNRFPRLAMSVDVLDAETGRSLASGRIEQVQSYAGDNSEAQHRLGLVYSRLGTDTAFQALAGMTNAAAASLHSLVRQEGTPTGPFTIGQAPVGTGSVPIRINRSVYLIDVVPPEASEEPN